MASSKTRPPTVTVPLAASFPAHCLDLGREETWEQGQTIPRPKPGKGLYLLASGDVRMLHCYTVDGREETRLLFMVPGPNLLYEAVGLVAIGAATRAVPLRRSVTVFLERRVLERLLNTDPLFTAYVLQTVTMKAGQITRHMLWGTFGDAEEALLDLLYERTSTEGREADGHIRLKISRESLAEDMGTHSRTILRWQQKLEEDGIIELWRGGVTLLRPERGDTTLATRNLIPNRKRTDNA